MHCKIIILNGMFWTVFCFIEFKPFELSSRVLLAFRHDLFNLWDVCIFGLYENILQVLQ